MRSILPALVLLSIANAALAGPAENEPIAIGSRLELFVDDHFISKLSGAKLVLQKPTPREVVLTNDAAWEGNECAYYSIVRDVRFKSGSDMSDLSGKPIRLRFAMKDADLFSIRFQ